MGDSYQTILDIKISQEDATEKAEQIRGWMINKGIILSELSDCVLGEEGGYPPGTEYSQITKGRSELVAELTVNGVEISAQREYAHGMIDEHTIKCNHCGAVSETPEECFEGIGRWLEGEDEPLISCPACNVAKPYNEWEYRVFLSAE